MDEHRDDQRTCGQGLAEGAALPAKVGVLMTAMAEVLLVHTKALDLTNELARKEHEAYREIAKALRSIAAQSQAAAMKMTACRSLPMAPHDPKVMLGREPLTAFKTFVAVEHEVAALLEQRLEEDRRLLDTMNEARTPS